jgi:MSHA biogenesis protein MshP
MTPTKVFAPKPQSLEPGTWNLERGAWNAEPGTWNLEPGTWNREAGLSLVTAIFLMVVLALLGAFMLSVTAIQQSSLVLDVQGVRAYQAARTGIEWGAFQVLDPNNTLNPITCSPVVLPGCPAPSTTLSGLAGSLSPFWVTVTCSAVINAPTTEGNRNIGAYQIIATACNQPSSGVCPNATPASGYVERQLQATLSKCKDPTATAPRCACG